MDIKRVYPGKDITIQWRFATAQKRFTIYTSDADTYIVAEHYWDNTTEFNESKYDLSTSDGLKTVYFTVLNISTSNGHRYYIRRGEPLTSNPIVLYVWGKFQQMSITSL